MAAPVTGEASLDEERSGSQIVINKLKTPNSAEDNLIIAQLSKTALTQLHVPCASSLSKRRKSKPMRFDVSRTDVRKEHSSPKIKIVLSDPSVPCLSLTKEKSPTKGFKTPVPSSPAMIRALEVQSSLGIEFPSCIKIMVRSQVSCGFWMGLPLPFCRSFLPKEDTTFLLEDEKGEQCEVKYIAYKSGLSAGWKKFAVTHNLIEGDVLVFHLVEPWKFKVYILKANVSNEVDGALSLLNLEAHTEQITPVTPSPKTKRSKHTEPLSLTVVEKKHKKTPPSSRSIPPSQLSSHRIEHSGNDSEEVGSEVLEGSRPSKPVLLFQEVKAFEEFRIVVKGLCIDSELPDDVRASYYKLCLDRKQFLHDGLREGLYYKLVAGMIGETVSIANEIKNCKPTTTKEEFGVWDDSLRSFELLGMKVGFLRDRIHTLATLVSEGALDMKRYVEARNEQKRIKDEIKKLTEKISELKENARKFERISGSLKRKAEKYEHRFRDALGTPW
ncbi:B3 domain-containing protein Os01g0234100-like isoform X2 [Cynara cardunculus var. scolymus]|uniref:B3 domain-containing protein Os01g0234100-like isoform X2 n=1 Tax=Cynara cardunculus var. scolymus TaxID=59895 RepID=UPI000D6282D4|nr:B3 domain-containing protein Os01g0234100-like isoform X2 [Cynara cardunculus var. scolymus]